MSVAELHKTPRTVSNEPMASTDPLARLREPFADHQISKLPKESRRQIEDRKTNPASAINCSICGSWHHKNAVHLDYVGHAALTDRLLDTDMHWSWEPAALTPEGLPAFDRGGGLWIRLTVCGVTRLGYGAADGKTGGDAIKEIIGDALRNAAMRFGAALDLWHKGDLHLDDDTEAQAPSLEERAISHLTSCAVDRATFKGAWETCHLGWRKTLEPDAYARVVDAMKQLAATLPEPEPAQFDPLPDDEIPGFDR